MQILLGWPAYRPTGFPEYGLYAQKPAIRRAQVLVKALWLLINDASRLTVQLGSRAHRRTYVKFPTELDSRKSILL